MASDFRRSFKQKAKEAFGLPFRFRMRLDNVDSEDSGSKVRDGKSSEEFATRSASFDFGYFSPNTQNSGETATQLMAEPSTVSASDNFVMIESQNKKTKRCQSFIQPKGTLPYTVSMTDTLASIAARFETTTSELKTLNRLMSNMVFPGKIIYIPDKDYIPSDSESHPVTPPPPLPPHPVVETPLEGVEEEDQLQTVPSDGTAEETSKLISISMPDPDLLLTGVKPILSVARHTSTASAANASSEGGAKEGNWHEQFIKLNVEMIGGGGGGGGEDGVVGGVLLITPTAVMFESNSGDDHVLKHGRDSYDVIIPMAVIVGVVITEDHLAPKASHLRESSLSFEDDVFSCKSEHSTSTGTTKTEDTIQKQIRTEGDDADDGTGDAFAGSLHKGTSGDQSAIAGDHSAIAGDHILKDEVVVGEPLSPANRLPLPDVISCGNAMNVTLATHSSKSFQPDTGGDKDRIRYSLHASANAENFSLSAPNVVTERETEIQDDNALREVNEKRKLDLITKTNEIDGKMVEASDKINITYQVKTGKIEEQRQNTDAGEVAGHSELSCLADDIIPAKASPKEPLPEAVADSPRKRCSTLVGNIFRFHSSSSIPEPSPSKGTEKTADAAPNKDAEAESSALPARNRLMMRTLESLTSYSRPLVDLSSSLFSRSGSDSRSPKQDEEKPDEVSSFPKFDISKEKELSSDPLPCQRMFFLRPFDRLARKNRDSASESTQESNSAEQEPAAVDDSTEPENLFLCLKIAKSIDWSALADCPLESLCFSTRLRQEYWFSIPSNRADHLYAFFLQWSPNLSGQLDEANLEDKGFVVINSTDGSFGFIGLSDEVTKQGASYQPHKEWEIINAKEVRRMINNAEIESLPLPELSEASTIMDHCHIRELCFHLPPRAEGSSWQLVYSSEKNGFSLKTLYRHMFRVDSPILLVIKDDSNLVFGAMLPCALKLSDGFYGSGESYLFSFYPHFMKYAWTGNNNYFIKGNAESLSIGAGEGVYGLWLDGDLYHGRTQPCRTYNNELLTLAEDFMIQCLEVWKFV